MARKPKPQPQVVSATASITLLESVVHWGDTIHFAVSGDGLFDVRVVVLTGDTGSVSFTSANQGWALTLGPRDGWPVDSAGNPVGGEATAELEGPPDANADHAILATTTFTVLP